MKTVVITMDSLRAEPPGAGSMVYPVSLFFDDGGADWMKKPLATSTIPQDLSIPNPPLDPVTEDPIDGQQISDTFLKEEGNSARFQLFGDYLYQLLFQGAVAQEWDRLRALHPKEVAGQSEGLRTILDIKPDTLRWLPWELIYKAPMSLFFDSANPFVRGTLEKQLPIRSFTWPIHVLIVVGSQMKDEKVNAEQEIEAIQYAFIKSPLPIDWEIRYRPTKAELSDVIVKFKPQILHFIGHGKELTGYPYLELVDKNGVAPPEEWTVDDITIDILNWQPRIAFVNACRTSSSVGQKNSWDIARAFSNAKVPAVVGMQADIKGDAAAAFSGKFYASLVNGLPLDSALAEARAAVRNLPTITLRSRDWALATLYLQQLPEQILEMQPAIDKQTSDKFRIDSKLQETRDFVGRRTQRRKLWYGIDQIPERDDEFGSLFIVVGNKDMGKTSLVQTTMKVCALRQRKVTYVDIGYESTKDFVEVLRIIREGDPKANSIICQPLPSAPFADFDQEYGELLKKREAATILAGDTQLCEHLFTAYKTALVNIAATEPLIIALDNLGVEWEQFKTILVPRLLLPIAQNQLPNCRLILIVTAAELSDRLPQELKDRARVIEVLPWAPAKFAPLAREICVHNDLELARVNPVITTTSELVTSDWGPTRLRSLVNLLKLVSGAGV